MSDALTGAARDAEKAVKRARARLAPQYREPPHMYDYDFTVTLKLADVEALLAELARLLAAVEAAQGVNEPPTDASTDGSAAEMAAQVGGGSLTPTAITGTWTDLENHARYVYRHGDPDVDGWELAEAVLVLLALHTAERARAETAERQANCDCIPDVFSSMSCQKCGRRGTWPNERIREWVNAADKAEARAVELEGQLTEAKRVLQLIADLEVYAPGPEAQVRNCRTLARRTLEALVVKLPSIVTEEPSPPTAAHLLAMLDRTPKRRRLPDRPDRPARSGARVTAGRVPSTQTDAARTPHLESTKAVLRELRDAVGFVEAALDECRKKQAAARRASTAHQRAVAVLDAAQTKRDRLRSAADLLADDWRQWPWVKEAGFAAKVPHDRDRANEALVAGTAPGAQAS